MTNPRPRSFGAVAPDYARHRPGYPADAVAWALDHAPGPALLDLGAGTGKLTEALVARPGAQVTAVEPDPSMLAELQARLPRVDARVGTAEAVPLADASVDAVLVGTAWHWFDPDRALPEMARVLRPGGVLALLGNGDDASVDWVAGFHEATVPHRPPDSALAPDDYQRTIPVSPLFGHVEHARFANPRRTTIDGLIATLHTHSWALVSAPAERDAAMAAVRAYLLAHPATASGEFTLPTRTDVLRARLL